MKRETRKVLTRQVPILKRLKTIPKNDRILLVIPNYATVENPTPFVRISVKEKFKLGAEDSFDPYSFLIAGILAGVAQAENEDAAWGRGWEGFGKRYAAGFVDAADGSFMTTGVFPSIFHEDPRYFRKGSGGFWSRSGYAVKRLLVTRTDSDRNQFNISEVHLLSLLSTSAETLPPLLFISSINLSLRARPKLLLVREQLGRSDFD